MRNLGHDELYREFIDFVRKESHRERNDVNRRMFSVLLWCFLIPAIVYSAGTTLIKLGILPSKLRLFWDWVILLFPVGYSIFFLGQEVIRGLPEIFRRGGLATTLGQCVERARWRERVMEQLKKQFELSPGDWMWLRTSFERDIDAIQFRSRYMTGLAGAIFYLLTQGIDFLFDDGSKVTWVKDPTFGWVEIASTDYHQLVALGLFLVLLYLAGSQTYQALKRYLDCLDLIVSHRSD